MSVDTTDSSVTARVGLGMAESGLGYALEVELVVALPKADRAQAEAVVARTDQVCPYSNATRGNIEVSLTIA